jgi:6-phosphogluconolactonase
MIARAVPSAGGRSGGVHLPMQDHRQHSPREYRSREGAVESSHIKAAASAASEPKRWSRRGVAACLVAGALTPVVLATTGFTQLSTTSKGGSAMSDLLSYFAYVGARTTKERDARGNGLNVYRVDAKTGVWTHVQLLSDLVNPSFLAFDHTQHFLYAVHGDLSDISAFAVDRTTGKLSPINRRSTGGKNPVHLAIDPTNRFVVVANHITSTIALLPREPDGSLGELVNLVKLEGKIGPHRVEQPFAKPHQTEFDPSGKYIVVPDKGLDRIFTFRLDGENRKLIAVGKPAEAREGAGPRHIAFHPNGRLAYVINELDSTVTAYRFDPATGALEPFQLLSALPNYFTGNSRASEIAISADGRFLYASNRGYDSIAMFGVDQADGRLFANGWQISNGSTPRFFTIDPTGRFLFVANEESDTIVTCRVDQSSGKLTMAEGGLTVGSPVCIVFATTS